MVIAAACLGLGVALASVAVGVNRLDRGGESTSVPAEEAIVTGDPEGPRTLVVGDSVTFQSAADITNALGDEVRLDIRGRPGHKTFGLMPTLRDGIDNGDPEVVVLLVGYNDIWTETDPEPSLTEIADLVAERSCVVWLLLPTKGPWEPELAEAFNARVEQLAADRPSIQVEPSWRDLLDATGGPNPDPFLIDPDRVHPRPAGQVRLAEVMSAAVRRHCL